MAKMTRLASTVTARYFPASDLSDAFFLDGRLSGKREARAADITVDKEDRGFLFSVFSHATMPGRENAAEPAYEAPLRKLYNEIKSGRKALDDEIGDLVNTAVAVTGRMRLQADNARTPFFAGVMVKDSEAFAITMGKGLAFLYRDDTLYPLTATDLRIDPINTQRQKVDNFYNYCATKTATALCSNIAQLKMDDCIILCNREVYDALGQHELLRILYEAEDQCDAAGIVVTEAAAKMPGVPLQFMISFVEAVTAQEKSGLFGFGRKNRQQSYNETEDDAIEVPIAKNAAPLAVGTPAAAAAAPEPLYFGTESSNPFVSPLAEQPVNEAGPQDGIQFRDETLAPFGEPVNKTEPEWDESGFVRTDYEAEEEAAPVKEEQAFEAPYVPEDRQTPQYIPEEPEEEGEPLVFGDDSEPVPQAESAFVTPAAPVFQESQAPQVPKAPESESIQEQQGQQPASGSFFIPFEEAQEPAPQAKAKFDDIPDMPLYEAPSYTPPTYPTNSFTPKGYDSAGVYARGSYSVEDEDTDFDVRKDVPPQRAPSRNYSYTPPQQTVPSYGSMKAAQAAQGQSVPGQPAQGQAGAQRQRRQGQPQQPQQRPGQPSYAQGQRQYQEDMFDQEQQYEYGAADAAYKRNKIWVAALIGISVICVIILVVALVTSNNKKNQTSTTTAPSVTLNTSVSSASGSDTSASGSDTAASGTSTGTSASTPTSASGAVNPSSVTPIGEFYFSDQTGFRTWWDVFNTAYQIQIETNDDPRIATIISYNNLAADYVPQPGDTIKLPPVSVFTA